MYLYIYIYKNDGSVFIESCTMRVVPLSIICYSRHLTTHPCISAICHVCVARVPYKLSTYREHFQTIIRVGRMRNGLQVVIVYGFCCCCCWHLYDIQCAMYDPIIAYIGGHVRVKLRMCKRCTCRHIAFTLCTRYTTFICVSAYMNVLNVFCICIRFEIE